MSVNAYTQYCVIFDIHSIYLYFAILHYRGVCEKNNGILNSKAGHMQRHQHWPCHPSNQIEEISKHTVCV